MIEPAEIFDKIFLTIIKNNYSTAFSEFYSEYQNSNSETLFFNGCLISLLLNKDLNSVISFLNIEKKHELKEYKELLCYHLITSVSAYTGKSDIFLLLATILLKQNKLSEAETFIRAAQLLKPNDISIIKIKAELSLLRGDYDKTASLYLKASRM
jgi:hypothetical protein